MKEYEIFISNQFYDNLEEILHWIKQDSLMNHNHFREGIKKTLRGLTTFPESGKNLAHNTKAKVYSINHREKTVNVIDLIDPQQHIKAAKYL
jgi:plasmid stabilization system protein ParE